MKVICYQCEKECNYLFDDGRCHLCTRLTVDEVRGIESKPLMKDASDV